MNYRSLNGVMSGAPARGTVPRRQRRHHHHHHHHHHHQKHQKDVESETPRDEDAPDDDEPEVKRPKVNPIFLWASQREQRIIEVRCEDYDKRNRIKLTKTAQGWRSIPRTTSNVYSIAQPAAAGKTKMSSLVDSPASLISSNDEKENGKQRQEAAPPVTTSSIRRPPRRYTTNGVIDSLLTIGESAETKGRYRDVTTARSNERSEREENGEINRERNGPENRLSSFRNELKLLKGRINLERLQKDKLFQPRVVLEQLHLSQLPESAHQNVVRRPTKERGKSKLLVNETERAERNERDEKDAVDEAEEKEEMSKVEEKQQEDAIERKKEEKDTEKRCWTKKADIQDILNMIDATASPVLAADTPSADLPLDSTKTYEVLDESAREKQPNERKVKDASYPAEQSPDNAKDRSKSESVANYQVRTLQDGGNKDIEEKLEVHEEKILENYPLGLEETKVNLNDKVILLSLKSNTEEILRSCKVAETDGSLVSSQLNSNSLIKWPEIASEEIPLETEEEAPDEPGEPMKINYDDNSKILDALRNTPGLSVSVTRNYTPEISKSNLIASPARPSSKASSSRSPDSQTECVEKLLKNSMDSTTSTSFLNNRGHTSSPRNLPGLSIIIPSYRYRNATSQMAINSPSTKRHVESPESTVSFNKTDAYSEEMKLDGFRHEGDEREEEEEDDCDSQVLEDLRRQKTNMLAYNNVDTEYYNDSRDNQENFKISLGSTKGDPLWVNFNRSNEAQAKCKYQDLEHFDEQVLEELRSCGTVVSPQPSGIPCSPASRRSSSAYLERLLPSPPCSVSCSEDAKSELTLKNILASSNCMELKNYENSKDGTSIQPDHQGVDSGIYRSTHSSVNKNTTAKPKMTNRSCRDRSSVHSQESRNLGRPMSNGDIYSSFYTTDRVSPKRPMSAEWKTGRRKNQAGYYQKSNVGRTRNHFADYLQDTCATSSSTDKLMDPANQLRELIETAGHLIPDPLLVPRDYLPSLAAAPATEIPKLLATRPELRLPEALTKPNLLRDPDLLVISLAHLQHVLDHGEGPVSRSQQQPSRASCNGASKESSHSANHGVKATAVDTKPKLSCKPIGTLMPAPIDLSNGRTRINPCPPLLRVRSGLLKQEPEVTSTAGTLDELQLWHPLFGR